MHETFDWLWRLATAECLFAAWGYSAFAIATRLVPTSGIALRWTAGGVAGIWLLTVQFHVLLAFSAFTLPWAAALALGAAFLSYAVCGGSLPVKRFASDLAYLRDLLASGAGGRPRTIATVAGSFAVLVVAFRAMLVPVVAWDSLTYHAVKSAMWVQQGGPITLVAPGGFSIYRDYPGGGELLHAWAMLPLRSDLLTGAVDAATWLLLGLAVHALGAQFGLSSMARFSGAAYVMAIPAVARAVGSLYVDNALALALVAACALALFAMRRSAKGAEGVHGALVLVGMAFGVAIGIKVFALPVAGAALLALFVIVSPRLGPTRTLATAAAGGAALLAAGAPWFAGNWLRTGYPLSPFPVEVAGITLGRANPALLWYMDRPATAAAGLVDELRALAKTFGVPGITPLDEPTLGVVTMLVALVAAVSVARLFRRDWLAALVSMAFVVPMIASYFGSGLKNTRLIWASVSGRYLLAAVALSVVLSLACCRRHGSWRTGYQALLLVAAAGYAAASNVRGWTGVEALAALAAALVVSGGLWVLRTERVRLGRHPGTGLAWVLSAVLLLVGFGSLQIYRQATRYSALRHSIALHKSPRYWVPALAAIDDPARPRTVAVTAGASQDNDNWMVYPVLGRRLQNTVVYVPVTADGEIVDLANNEERIVRASYDAWRERLAERGVNQIISFAPPSLELFWMERDPAVFRRLAGDGRRWGLYQFAAGDSGD